MKTSRESSLREKDSVLYWLEQGLAWQSGRVMKMMTISIHSALERVLLRVNFSLVNGKNTLHKDHPLFYPSVRLPMAH